MLELRNGVIRNSLIEPLIVNEENYIECAYYRGIHIRMVKVSNTTAVSII